MHAQTATQLGYVAHSQIIHSVPMYVLIVPIAAIEVHVSFISTHHAKIPLVSFSVEMGISDFCFSVKKSKKCLFSTGFTSSTRIRTFPQTGIDVLQLPRTNSEINENIVNDVTSPVESVSLFSRRLSLASLIMLTSLSYFPLSRLHENDISC
jgi:hypothetical protein